MDEGPLPRDGWYVDPLNSSRIRFHDGAEWTDTTMDPVTDDRPPLDSGWYPDPLDDHRSRYYDGNAWTDDVEPVAVAASGSPSPRIENTSSPRRMDRASFGNFAESTSEGSDIAAKSPRKVAFIAAGGLMAMGGILFSVWFLFASQGNEQGAAQAPASTAGAAPDSSGAPAGAASSAPATPAGPPILTLEDKTSSSPMWQVTWQKVTADQVSERHRDTINKQLERFSDSEAVDLAATLPLDPADYNSLAGSYSHKVEIIPCPEPLLCLVKRGAVYPPGGGSGFGILQTLVLDYQTETRVTISDYVAESQLAALSDSAASAVIASGEAYEGLPVRLVPEYSAFADFVPQDDGLLLFFGEYVVGPTPVEVFVSWASLEGGDSSGVAPITSLQSVRAVICDQNPRSLPPLVNSSSNYEGTRAIQVILLELFGLDPGPIDGQYGPRTISAVKSMQAQIGVVPDGQVGPITWGAVQGQLCFGA